LRAYAYYTGALRAAVLRLKYYRDVAMGEVLARPMIYLYHSLGWAVDVVCPTPAGAGRLRQRGYNQTALLARPLALACGLMYNDRILVKIRETRSQVGLSVVERQGNVAGAFQATATAGARLPRRVLVVDDTTTTGATLEACSQALREAGVEQVYCLALAQAKYRPAVRAVRINELERCDAGG
jgi:ComF family protein